MSLDFSGIITKGALASKTVLLSLGVAAASACQIAGFVDLGGLGVPLPYVTLIGGVCAAITRVTAKYKIKGIL